MTGRQIALMSASLVAQGGYIHLHGPHGEFDIEGFATVTASNPSGPGQIALSGRPVRVFWREKGLQASGNSLKGETGVDAKSGEYYLKSGQFSGGVKLESDSDAAYDYLSKHPDAGPAPSRVPRVQFGLSSEVIGYQGDSNVGSINLPERFTGTWSKQGVETVKVNGAGHQRQFEERFATTGVSGEFAFNTLASGADPLRTGTIQGPATFKVTRTSMLDSKSEPNTTVDGTADRIDFDFLSAAKTVTLTGNVHFDGTGFTYPAKGPLVPQVYTGSTQASKAVITLGEDGEIERVDMEGVVTNIKPQGGGR